MIFSSIMSIEMNGGRLQAPTVHCQEVDTRGVGVAMPVGSIFLAENSLRPSKGLFTIITISGGLTHRQENGPDWRARVEAHLPEVAID